MKKFILFFLFCVVSMGFSVQFLPKVEKGYIDLRRIDWSQDVSLPLDGEWEYYSHEYIQPGESKKNEHYFQIPGPWNIREIQNKAIHPLGHASYRIYILARPDSRQVVGLRIPQMMNAYSLFVNGKFVIQVGKPGTNKATTVPLWEPKNAYFLLDKVTNEIVFHMANYRYVDGGIQRSVTLGNPHSVNRIRDQKAGLDNFLWGIFLIMGFYHLGLFALRRKDHSALWFGLFSLIVGLRTLITNERILIGLWENLSWELAIRLEYVTMPLAGIFFLYYLKSLFPAEARKPLVLSLVFANVLYAVVCTVTSIWFFSSMVWVFHIIILIMALAIIVAIIVAGIRKREGAWLVIGGFSFLVASIVNDILFVNSIVYTGHMLPYGVFIFIFSQSFILSRRFSLAFDNVEMMTKKLQEYNKNLSEIVESRTEELQKERNLLKRRNETIEFELDLARQIQLDLIPAVSHMENLYFYYKPMEKVGGDFYDFIQYRESDQVGIFISDVSGHGVPAALVTSMIKSTLLQVASHTQDPAQVMSLLNSALHNKTAGNFVTAFYGILNMKTRDFRYTNAGHNIPYLLENKLIQELDGDDIGMPLSILTNSELEEKEKFYITKKMRLKKGSKLFFYTDGLMEAIPFRDKGGPGNIEDFESSRFYDTVTRIKDLPCQFFIKEMANSLIEFRGNEVFDDDVCMICVDL